MSTERKTFYRVTCDYPGCKEMLTDGETYWWDGESIEPMCTESEWLIWPDLLATQHFCFDHWTTCDECGEQIPLHLARLVNDDEHWCADCERRVTEEMA